MKILKKTHPYLIFIFVAFIIWWSKDYFHPGTYLNIGDAAFPFMPEKYSSLSLYTWQDGTNEGLGQFQVYNSAIISYYYIFIQFLKTIGIPLWICNRLFFFIPTFFILLTSYYMILSFIKGPNKQAGAILGSIFLTTSNALLFNTPMLLLANAGIILSFASLKRFIEQKKNYHLIVYAFGFLLMSATPRHIYISIFFHIFFLICWNIVDRNNFKSNFRNIFKLFSIGIILIILLNLSTFLPTITFLFKHPSSELMQTEEAFLSRLEGIGQWKGSTSLLYTLRLLWNVHPFSSYFSNNFNLLVSFLILFFLFIPFFKRKISKKLLCILLTSGFIIFWLGLFNFDLYKLLAKIIPGFWIMNNPLYVIIPLALMYSIMLANSTTTILSTIEKKVISIKIKNVLSAFSTVGILILIVINNGIYFFDSDIKPKDVMYLKDETRNIYLGNHLPYFKIPSEYQNIEEILPEEDKDTRVFILPYKFVYMKYSWYPYYKMPEFSGQLNYLRVGGINNMAQSKPERVEELILNGEYNNAINMLRSYGYKYILIHKDMTPYMNDELNTYLTKFSTVEELEIVDDNNYFRLLKLKPQLNSNYTFPSVDIVNGNLDTLNKIPNVNREPQITFKKINPTKFIVKVEGAKDPFWLKFSESFHNQWYLYQIPYTENQMQEFKKIVADYPDLKVKEAKYLIKYTPEDIRFLFKKPLDAQHDLVNEYANGWYIEPDKLGLSENFILVIYFWPQSLFYISLGISVVTLIGCIGYILWIKIKKDTRCRTQNP
ncbi:MAG: hypothetical protein ACYCXQ_04470 [Candidatus Humimicrobiaceae bacterium]